MDARSLREMAVGFLRFPEAPEEDLRAFVDHARERSADFGRVLTLVLTLAIVLTWPVDVLLFRDEPAIVRGLAEWRVAEIAVLAGVYVASGALPRLRRRAYELTAVTITVAAGLVGVFTATL